jgi:hypothetical protein
MPDINKFPDYFRGYSWNSKHRLFGYPADTFPEFGWIGSLERRFLWLRANATAQKTAALYLIREMIQWGGSQNGTLQKFDDGIGECNLYALVERVINNLGHPTEAIRAALQIPGMGLTYASKLLRFLDPCKYGALDGRIRDAFRERLPAVLPRIHDSYQASQIAGYSAFIVHLDGVKLELDRSNVPRPQCALAVGSGATEWRNADIEMALFGWADGGDL